jgi:hypothetical protein
MPLAHDPCICCDGETHACQLVALHVTCSGAGCVGVLQRLVNDVLLRYHTWRKHKTYEQRRVAVFVHPLPRAGTALHSKRSDMSVMFDCCTQAGEMTLHVDTWCGSHPKTQPSLSGHWRRPSLYKCFHSGGHGATPSVPQPTWLGAGSQSPSCTQSVWSDRSA